MDERSSSATPGSVGDFLCKFGTHRIRAWDRGRERYVCRDGTTIGVPTGAECGGELRTVRRNALIYQKDEESNELCVNLSVSGVQLDREVSEIFESLGSIRTIIFPATVRTVGQGVFFKNQALRSARLNEGLETLGADEYDFDGEMGGGVFEDSGLEKVFLPSTLRRIEYSAFEDCGDLRTIRLPEGLWYIGKRCFYRSGLEKIVFPGSLRTVCAQAFA